MVAWEVSRHPEWDQMFLAGLTAKEIADLCHQNVATVHAHMHAREKYQPGFNETHQKALFARHPDRPSTAWKIRLNELRGFVNEHGRLPEAEQATTPSEVALCTWLLKQRHSFSRNDMSPGKIHLLDSLPGWRAESHTEMLERRWMDTLNETVAFVALHGEIPRYKLFADEQERRLGVWLHNQRQSLMTGKLSEARSEALQQAMPGWRSRR